MKKNWIIEVRNIKQYFKMNDRLTVHALEDVSFGMERGEVFGLIGETGCGKSTMARVISGIYQPTSGEVLYNGICVSGPNADKQQVKKLQNEMQMVFQDSAASLNPRMTIAQIILEPLRIQKQRIDHKTAQQMLEQMMESVGLSPSYLTKRPGELSGGQRQRVSIARSLILNPQLIIADEPVASLDISIQAQIINLFKNLQKEKNFSFLFIAHDLSVVRFISDRVGVMLNGKLVELAETEELYQNPIHPYTKSLLSAIHYPDPIYERQKKILYYDTSLPLGSVMKEHSPGHFVLE
ncbi:MAG: ATP-binding cassette domain-containing protein [Eubacteriales bacterium]|nr:ATP-binding cassette domain-containing protein [Eubacteriales bacterium]